MSLFLSPAKEQLTIIENIVLCVHAVTYSHTIVVILFGIHCNVYALFQLL